MKGGDLIDACDKTGEESGVEGFGEGIARIRRLLPRHCYLVHILGCGLDLTSTQRRF